jgi:hypothetical protein
MMNQNSDQPKLNPTKKKQPVLTSNVSAIDSLEEIPDFDTAEDEVKFWQHHAISKMLLDEVPNEADAEDAR